MGSNLSTPSSDSSTRTSLPLSSSSSSEIEQLSTMAFQNLRLRINPATTSNTASCPIVNAEDALTESNKEEKDDEDILDTIQAHLRQKYLKDIEVVQRRVFGDPESWSKLDEAIGEIDSLNRLLKVTDELGIVEGNGNKKPLRPRGDLAVEVCCPVCMDEMVAPRRILCCSNGHPICSSCNAKVKFCPVCREDFTTKGRPVRNKFAERLIRAYLSKR